MCKTYPISENRPPHAEFQNHANALAVFTGVKILFAEHPELGKESAALSSSSEIEELLHRRTQAARECLLRKRAEFDSIVEAIQQGTAGTEGARRIGDAGRELAAARIALTETLSELHAYLTAGIVPKHLTSAEME
jgi:hypothetical protein